MASIEEIVRRIVREEVRAALADRPQTGVGPAPAEDHLLTTAEAAVIVGAAPQTLRNWRTARTGPPAVKLGSLTRYRRSDLDEWIRRRRE